MFAQVYICDSCFTIATRMEQQIDSQLRRMQVFLRESIRVALVEGKLNLATASGVEEVPKADVLRMIVKLSEQVSPNGQPVGQVRPALQSSGLRDGTDR